jgi:hypothetical protein
MGTGDHAKNSGKNLAKLARDSKYRTSGYSTIKGDGSKRLRYGNLQLIQEVLQERQTRVSPATDSAGRHVPPGSIPHARRYVFVHGPNFKIGGSPYANQAHHMLPQEAFTDTYLTSEQREIMNQVKYDLNNGKNIIFLPESESATAFHDLPSHSGSHDKYTRIVVADMGEIKAALNKGLETDPDHKNYSPQDIRDQLYTLQDKYWRYLTTCGAPQINKFKKPKRTRFAG